MKKVNELREILSSMSVNELMELNNEITAEIRHRKDERVHDNARILDAEVRNLIDGVGDGYTPNDCYAKERYYSTIDGVKNFRMYYALKSDGQEESVIEVKILSPKGKLLPKEITVRNIKYKIEFISSKNYSMGVDY